MWGLYYASMNKITDAVTSLAESAAGRLQSPMPADEHGPLTGTLARSGSPVEKHTEASVCDDDILKKHPI